MILRQKDKMERQKDTTQKHKDNELLEDNRVTLWSFLAGNYRDEVW